MVHYTSVIIFIPIKIAGCFKNTTKKTGNGLTSIYISVFCLIKQNAAFIFLN